MTPESESAEACHRHGAHPPSVEPKTAPIRIKRLGFMGIASRRRDATGYRPGTPRPRARKREARRVVQAPQVELAGLVIDGLRRIPREPPPTSISSVAPPGDGLPATGLRD